MKFTTCLLALISTIPLLNGQTYSLDEEDYLPPKGVILERKSSFNLENGRMQIKSKDREMNGQLKSLMANHSTLTNIGDQTILSLIIKDTSISEASVDGKVLSKEEKEHPLTNVEMLYTKTEGKWSAKTKYEDLELTEEQKVKIEERLKQLNIKESLYGYEPRKVGDIWDMEKALLTKIGGEAKLAKAKGEITFKEVVQIEGHKCAKLLCKIDMEGIKDNTNMSLKGEVTVWRSLEFFTDVKSRGSLVTIIEPAAKNARIQITGNSVVSEDVTIKQSVLSK